jgi:hypothetical protein
MFNPLDYPIVFTKPKRLTVESAWNSHLPFAFYLIDALRPKTIVELGTHAGGSYNGFCQAVSMLGLQTRCYAIDTWQGDANAGPYKENVFLEISRYHDPLYSGFSTLLRTTFDSARPKFKSESIDLLHIDGLHTYEAVKHDYETWRDAVRPGGVVLFHDTDVRDRGFGVFRLWEELRSTHAHFEFHHGFGLGVLIEGGDVCPGLLPLVDATDDQAELIRIFFAAVGTQWHLEAIVGDKSAELDRIKHSSAYKLFRKLTPRSKR